MARFARLDVLNALIETGLLPIFHHAEVEAMVAAAAACAEGGARLFEFTNRGDFAPQVFEQAAQRLARTHPGLILGAGTIVDAPTAALYLAAGANFIVSPSLNPEVARLCNRRKVAYLPGCATATEIAQAEELGVEIVKLFPAETAGGPAFVKALLGPSPWTRLLPTGGVEPTRASLAAWFEAGVAAVGMGSGLFSKAMMAGGDYMALAGRVAETLALIRDVRRV